MALAFVTGATSGIGRATAVALAEAGYDLLVLGRRRDRLAELRRELDAVEVTPWVADVTRVADLQAGAKKYARLLADVDVLVNNAGLARGGVRRVYEAEAAHLDEIIDTNLKGLVRTTALVAPHMARRGAGHIVNVGSVAAKQVYGGLAVYAATKAAVASFSQSLRHDLAGTGVRVTNIEPGIVRSEFSLVLNEGDRAAAETFLSGLHPLESEDIARAIVWCVGQPLHVVIQDLVILPTDQVAPGKVVPVRRPPAR